MENEELRAELNRALVAAATLEEVGSLMDSIDLARNALKLELEAGTDYDDYIKRMEDINEYVASSEAKIDELEMELSKYTSSNQAYLKTISRLKKEVSEKATEIKDLELMVEKYRTESQTMANVVEMQEAEIFDLNDQIDLKTEELEYIEARIEELMKKSQMNEADSYFALGEALEEAAKRTRLAPRKRKETYKEAIEYYKKSLAFGREDAQERIDELEKKI